MKVRELIETLQRTTVPVGGDVMDLDINVVIGRGIEATLHPIQQVFRDDAPFCNLNCVFIVADMSKMVTRPPLFPPQFLAEKQP